MAKVVKCNVRSTSDGLVKVQERATKFCEVKCFKPPTKLNRRHILRQVIQGLWMVDRHQEKLGCQQLIA